MKEKDYSIDRVTREIGVLARRETEARILIPVIQALADRLGRKQVVSIVAEAITDIAQDQGCDLAAAMGGNTAFHFKDALEFWKQDNALEIEVRSLDQDRLIFDVTRCRYAEMYKALGAGDLGQIFSCNRDAALIQGFNPSVVMTRTQTIMAGASFCDFCYDFSADRPGGAEISS